MSDIDTLLHRAGEIELGGMEPGELRDRAARRRRARRAAWSGGAALVLVALVAGAIAVSARRAPSTSVIIGNGSSGDVTRLPSRWDARPGIADGFSITRVAEVGGLTLAVGSAPAAVPGSIGSTAAIWLSVHGSWVRVYTDPLPVPFPKSGGISDITYTHGRFVAVGQRLATGSTDVIAAVWTSNDGHRWQAVSDPSLNPGGSPIPASTSPARSSLAAVAVAPHGLIAIGQVFAGTFIGQTMLGGFAPAMWTSSDGRHWTRARLDLPGASSVTAMARLGGELVIAGRRDTTAAVWTSRDAVTWRPATVEGATTSAIADITAAKGRIVAVGSTMGPGGARQAAAWSAEDPSHLVRAVVRGDRDGVTLQHVTGAGAGFIAVGSEGSEATPSMVLMTSPDGATWTPTARNGDVFEIRATASTVGIADGTFVIVGATLTGTGSATDPVRPAATIWYAAS